VGKAHNLLDVAENIRLCPRYYLDATLQCVLRDTLGLPRRRAAPAPGWLARVVCAATRLTAPLVWQG